MKNEARVAVFLAIAAGLLGCSSGSGAASGTGGNGGAAGAAGSGGAGAQAGAGGAGAAPSFADAVRSVSWTQLPAAPSVAGGAKQDDIFFLDENVGFVASGPTYSLLRTDDGGANWTTMFNSPGTLFRAVVFLDAMHGFAGNIGTGLAPSITDDNVIYRTVDGGATWTAVANISGPTPKGICNFSAVDKQHVFAVGRANAPAHLVHSSDGGETWVSKDLSAWFFMAIDLRFTSATDGIVAGMKDNRCTIMRTTDGGDSFTQVFQSNTTGSLCWKIDFPSADVGYVTVQDTLSGPGTFAKTTDGGQTFQEMPLPTGDSYPGIGVGFITPEIGWMVSGSAQLPVYRTFDGGQTWEQEPALLGPINRFRFVSPTKGYAVGASVWKLEVPYSVSR